MSAPDALNLVERTERTKDALPVGAEVWVLVNAWWRVGRVVGHKRIKFVVEYRLKSGEVKRTTRDPRRPDRSGNTDVLLIAEHPRGPVRVSGTWTDRPLTADAAERAHFGRLAS